MLNYIRLIRLPNLLMIPITMYALRYGIVAPALKFGYSFSLQTTVELQFPDKLFLFVVIINMLLGAAGYVINDYFDRKIDAINRPDKVIIGKKIHRRTAIILHWVFNVLALVLAAFLSWKMRKPVVFIVYAMLSGIFWLYSTTYKKQLLIGNIVVAVLTALVPLQVAYFDLVPLNEAYGKLMVYNSISFKALLYWILAFASFAFFTNLVREFVKDIEDFEGDKTYDCFTLPVAIGVKLTKVVTVVFILGIISSIAVLYFKFLAEPLSKYYLLVALVIPFLLTLYLLIVAKTAKHYHRVSLLIKVIMLMGVLYAVVARFVMIFNFTV